MELPEGWVFLKDKEIIPANCVCFGYLVSGKIGWGKLPPHLIGEAYCVGWGRHPDFIAIKK